jgi:hypothetical protein
MENTAEAGFQIAVQNVDPGKLGEIIGMAPTGYNNSVAAACYYYGAEACQLIRQHGATTRQMLASPDHPLITLEPLSVDKPMLMATTARASESH